MSITFSPRKQPIQGKSNSAAMPTALPVTTHAESSPTKLSIAQLTDRIDSCVQTYLSATALTNALNSLGAPSPLQDQLDSFSVTPSAQVKAQFLNLQPIADAYSETCSLIWQQSLVHGIIDENRRDTCPTGDFSESLSHSLQMLCLLWATGKCQYPDAPFFQDAVTLGALQSKWRYPAIQESLCRTTERLRNTRPSDQWLAAYPTCWAYAVGRTMQQLLQWNYRLPPATLREFLILN